MVIYSENFSSVGVYQPVVVGIHRNRNTMNANSKGNHSIFGHGHISAVRTDTNSGDFQLCRVFINFLRNALNVIQPHANFVILNVGMINIHFFGGVWITNQVNLKNDIGVFRACKMAALHNNTSLQGGCSLLWQFLSPTLCLKNCFIEAKKSVSYCKEKPLC